MHLWWRLEVDVWYLLSSLSLSTEERSLLSLELTSSFHATRQLALGTVLASRALNYRWATMPASFLCECWGSELWSSYLHNKHFTENKMSLLNDFSDSF